VTAPAPAAAPANPQRPPRPSAVEIRRAVDVLCGPLSTSNVVELRALGADFGGRGYKADFGGFFSDADKLTNEAVKLSRAGAAVYVTLNPPEPALLSRAVNRVQKQGKRSLLTKDAEVACRRWLLVDLDPNRPTGVSATDEELALAEALVEELLVALVEERGWPLPVTGISGNGWHGLWRIDLPNDAEALALVKAVLEALSARFSTAQVKVDTGVFNASRITKLFGTVANKGDHCPEAGRPHRLSRLVNVPDFVEVVPREALERAVAEWGSPTETSSPQTAKKPTPASTKADAAKVARSKAQLAEWLQAWHVEATGPRPMGGGWKWIPRAPCPGPCGETDGAQVVGVTAKGAFFYRCHHERCTSAGIAWAHFRGHWDAEHADKPLPEASRAARELVEGLAARARGEEGPGVAMSAAALEAIEFVKQESPEAWAVARAALKAVPGVQIASVEKEAKRRARKLAVEQKKAQGRTFIEVSGRVHEMVEESEKALAKCCQDVYAKNGLLVRVRRDESIEGMPEDVIEPIPYGALPSHMTRAAEWNRQTKDGLAPCMPPREVVSALHVKGVYHHVRRLRGLSDCPVLRPDGTVADSPGYDAASGYLISWREEWPAVPREPTKQQAEDALALLRLELLSDFPFMEEADESAALAFLLTLIARPAIPGPVPLWFVDAAKSGTGKTLLARSCAFVALGQWIVPMEPSASEEEFQKNLTSQSMEGERLILIDNVNTAFGSATLDAAVTAGVRRARVLGVSRTVRTRVPLIVATGNNVAIRGDMVRRCVPVHIGWPNGSPYRRTRFRHPSLKHYLEHDRPRLLTAALTILRWQIASGYPQADLQALGSFEAWSALVRNALVWLGMPDPIARQEELRDADLAHEDLRVLLHAWIDAMGERWVSTRDLASTPREELRDALIGLQPKGYRGDLSPRTISFVLRKFVDNEADGMRLERGRKTKTGVEWRVQRVTEQTER